MLSDEGIWSNIMNFDKFLSDKYEEIIIS